MMIINRNPKRAYCTFILGQSNAVGQPQTGDPLGRTLLGLPTNLQGYQKFIRMWNNAIDTAGPGDDFEVQNVHAQNQKWGVDMGLCGFAKDVLGRAQYFAKFSGSGANISHFDPVTGDFWPDLSLGTERVVDWFNDRNLEVSYRVIWMQGESDCTAVSGHSTDFEGDLRDVVDAFRALKPELANVPFVFVKIQSAATAFYPTSAAVNAAFDTLAAESPDINFVADPPDFGTMVCPDGGHYNGASLYTLGRGLYNFCSENGI